MENRPPALKIPILQTKLHRPSLPANHVLRSRLLSTLEDNEPHMVYSANPHAGKENFKPINEKGGLAMSHKNQRNVILGCLLLLLGISSAGFALELDRTVLPIQPPYREPITVFDARDAEKPPRFKVTPPEGAPNVVIVLIDDIGFGAVNSFDVGCWTFDVGSSSLLDVGRS